RSPGEKVTAAGKHFNPGVIAYIERHSRWPRAAPSPDPPQPASPDVHQIRPLDPAHGAGAADDRPVRRHPGARAGPGGPEGHLLRPVVLRLRYAGGPRV